MVRLAPLSIDAVPELQELFAKRAASGHVVSNCMLTMATPLEDEQIMKLAEQQITSHGWKLGRYRS